MNLRHVLVLNLCLGLAAPALAQEAPSAPEAPPADTPTEDADSPAEPTAEVADEGGAAAPEQAGAEEPAPAAEQAPPAPAPEEAPAAPSPSEASASISAEFDLASPEEGAEGGNDGDAQAAAAPSGKGGPSPERCAQLIASGQQALAVTEGCDNQSPIYTGSQVSLSQDVAPMYRLQQDDDNAYSGLQLTLAPRLRLPWEGWALSGRVTLAYELTQPDLATTRHDVQSTDTTLQAVGNLGSFWGVSVRGGPRLVVPTSEAAWTRDTVGGLGGSATFIRPLSSIAKGLVAIVGTSYVHNFRLRSGGKPRGSTQERVDVGALNEDETYIGRPQCSGWNVTSETVTCSVNGLQAISDAIRLVGVLNYSLNDKINLTTSYMWAWNRTPGTQRADLSDTVLNADEGTEVKVFESDATWRNWGSFGMSASYQPTAWLNASLGFTTTVCYFLDSGNYGALGGCAGKSTGGGRVRGTGSTPDGPVSLAGGAAETQSKSRKALYHNPIFNAFTTVGLTLTVPIDQLVNAIRKGGEEKQVAKRERKRRAL